MVEVWCFCQLRLHRNQLSIETILFVGLLGGIAGGCATPSQRTAPLPEPYVRVSAPATGVVQLEIAARRFTPRRGSGATIWLTGASHLGEAAYYRALQTHLEVRSLVLFEGVGGPELQRGPRAPTAADQSSLQSRLAAALGLEFQLEALDYDRPHFRNSDLTVAELRELMAGPAKPAKPHQRKSNGAIQSSSSRSSSSSSSKSSAESEDEREDEKVPAASARPSEAARSFEQLLEVMQGDSFFGRLLNVGLRWLGTQPRYQALAKFTLVETINSVQGDLESVGALPPALKELLRVLIDERNQRVLADLRRELPRRAAADSLAVFYGAGHMRDLEQRLRRELRYEPRDEIWFAAITINVTAAGLSEAELAATRALIQQQIKLLRP